MRVMVIGGTGLEGSELVRDLMRSQVEEIIVTSRSLDKAKKAAEDFSKEGKSKVTAIPLEVNNHDEAVEAIKDADVDVVASTVGPFYIYGPKTAKIAIDAGVPYVDINDEFKPTRKVLEYDEDAKEADIPVLIGCGASPGCTNLLAAYGASKLDKVDKINIDWVWPATSGGGGFAVILHFLEIISGDCVQFMDGEFKYVPAGSGRREVDFSKVGTQPIAYVGHAEPETLPRFIEGVKEVTCCGGVYPPITDEVAYKLQSLGLTREKPFEVNGQKVDPREISNIILENFETEANKELEEYCLTDENGAIIVHITGEEDDNPVTYSYSLTHAADKLTANPASIAAQMIAKGEIKDKGVLTPEQLDVENIKEIFNQLKFRGFEIYEKKQVDKKL